ncbi:MAG TPA: helix-turn-helix domain-containing protein [Bryobacteraceae bacterium]|jgi:cytoskeletal protein RodZ|nr:helix-turn-helix domain-containing protein [Bryobacteraceae bacterium]
MRGSTSARPVDLTGWRNRKGISLSAIAAATKISERYLEAIEREKFASLPGGAYGLGYIRQYAQAIHYDVDRLEERYRAATAEPARQQAPEPWTRRIWQRLRSLR